jgi:8-oxo-dGTP pyrophosphatase MutT (NUDIX family)
VVSSFPPALSDRLSRLLLTAKAASELEVRGRTDAGVLVALYLDSGQLHAVFTKRRDDLRRHPGEISFPGGRREDTDPDLLATALREAEEEIGLARSAVRVLGALQPTPTIVTGYAIYPFVGLIEPGMAWTLSPREVAQVLELPLDDLLAGYGRRRLLRRGVPIRTDTYAVGDDLIWGATARIVADLFDRLDPLLGELQGHLAN